LAGPGIYSPFTSAVAVKFDKAIHTMPSLGNQDCLAAGRLDGSFGKKVCKSITKMEKLTTYVTTKSTKDTKKRLDDFIIVVIFVLFVFFVVIGLVAFRKQGVAHNPT